MAQPKTRPTPLSSIPVDYLRSQGLGLTYDAFNREIKWLDGANWVRLRDVDSARWAQDLERYFGGRAKCSSQKMHESAGILAYENKTDALEEWVLDLPAWDRVPRMDSWLTRHGGAPTSPYSQAVQRKFLLCMMHRALRPGVKVDTVLVLYGKQGIGKSTILSDLGSPFFSDKGIDVSNPAAAGMALRGVWLLEFGELDSMRKTEHTRLKQFLSHTEDNYRAPYGRSFEGHPRRCVFAGTSNRDDFLGDTTGSRRFWPIPFGEYVDRDGFQRDRLQLFAEAKEAVLYRQEGYEDWWLSREEESVAELDRAKVVTTDPWDDPIRNWLMVPVREPMVSLAEVLANACDLPTSRMDKGAEMRAADCMRRLGWRPRLVYYNGIRCRRWVRVSEQDAIPSTPAIVPPTEWRSHEQEVDVQGEGSAHAGPEQAGPDHRPDRGEA